MTISRAKSMLLVTLITCVLVASHPIHADAKRPTKNVHVFYYPWYGNPETDGHWVHWDHQYPDGNYTPPENIGANYYPALGEYSSSDPAVLDHQAAVDDSIGRDNSASDDSHCRSFTAENNVASPPRGRG
jgi:hypothetical protein